MATSTVIILVAGSMTFVNEWYQTNEINWKVPIATALGAALFEGFAKVSDKGATGLAVIVLIGAFVTRMNGKSPADTLAEWFGPQPKPKHHARVA
jgi:hypothetical protein